MRGIQSRIWNDEDGMTLVEIVVASVILFIILTGVLGLVLQTTRTSAQAKQQNVLTNAISSYTEWLNTLPFEKVDLVGHTDDGVLEPEHTIEEPPYTIIFRPTVTPGANPTATKDVHIDVEIIRVDGWSQQISTSVIIRDRTQFMTQASVDPADRPTVSFLPGTPPDGEVVWEEDWAGGKLDIKIEAHAAEGREIATVKYYLEYGNTPLENKGGALAQWTVNDPSFNSNFASSPNPFYWYTLQSQTDADGTVRRVAADGLHTIIVEVTDDRGASTRIHRTFIVDNEIPPVPGPLSFTDKKGSTTVITWQTVQDGTAPAAGYELEIRRQVGPTTWPIDVDPNPTVETNSYTLTHPTFSRYAARARSFSARPLYSDFCAWQVFVTRPLVSGTYRVEKGTGGGEGNFWRVTSDLTVTPPDFPTTGTTTYSFHLVDNGNLVDPPLYSGPDNTFTHTVQINGNPRQSNYPLTQYACVVTYTPDGYGGGTQTTIRSNTVLTEYQSDPGTYTFSEGTW